MSGPGIHPNMPSDRRIKILFVTSCLDTGGAEMFLWQLLGELDRDRFVPTVVSLRDRGTLGDTIEALGVRVHTLNLRGNVRGALSMLDLPRLMRKLRPDLIQGWMYHGNLAAIYARVPARLDTPVLWSIHHSIQDLAREKRTTRWLIKHSRWAAKAVSAIQYCSIASKNQHEALGYPPQLSVAIPNGFDCERFRPCPERRDQLRNDLGVPSNAKVIGHIARYHPMKDHANFIRAAACYASSETRARFVLAGRGVDESNAELVKLRADLGLQDRMFFLGEHDDTPILFQAFDLCSSSSAYGEAFPLVVGEAMASGVPCVVTDVGDSALIVGDTGLTVPARDHDALAAGWRALLDESAESRTWRCRAARARILEHFTLTAAANQFADLYQRLHRSDTRSISARTSPVS